MEKSDLIHFAIWIEDKMYFHRLTFMPNDLTDFYEKNRESIREYNIKANPKLKNL